VAIGNPMGNVHGSVTAGIISATERELTIDDVTISAIQTDAAINPGNSGGALFDSFGNVIGVVYAKSSSVSIEGIGYAIPVNDVKELIDQMINNPESVAAQTKGSQIMLGITIVDVTEAMSKQYNMPQGVYIREVAEFSAAERAGLRTGDIIVEFAGETVTCADDLNAIKAKQTSGDIVSVKIDRNGKEVVLEIILPQPTEVETQN
jgi:serine protease Do